jgi:hypothetical protein
MTNPIAPSITQSGRYEPFELQVSRGNVFGHEAVNLFAFTTVLGSTAFGPLWEGLTGSGGNYVYPSSAVVMVLTSSSASDTAVTIKINGLDGNFLPISETIALNGTANINTTLSYFRINSMTAVSGNAVGTITAKNGGTTYAQITIGIGQTQMSIYTVPAGYTLYQAFLQADSNTSATSGAFVRLRTYEVNNAAGGVVHQQQQSFFIQQLTVPIQYPLQYTEKSDLQWQLQGSGGAGAAANIFISAVLIKNNGTL